MKEKADIAGGLLSICCTVIFAVYLLNSNVPQNIASWTMWALLDALLLIACISAGNKKPWLLLGYTVGAFLVVGILFSKSGWTWGFVETISAIGTAIALLFWWKLGPRSAIVAIVVAMAIASIPAVCDATSCQNPAGWWYWTGISFSCVLSCYGAKAWTVEDRLFPVSSFLSSASMTLLLIT